MIMTNDDGALEILEAYFKGRDLTLKLFTNDITPADDDVAGDYTEAAGGGYAAKTLTAASWTGSIAAGVAQVAYAEQIFAFTGPLTGGVPVYGYYLVNAATGKVVYAERRSSAVTPENNGDTLLITPVFKLSKGTPA